jgi:hypothetical protein
MSLLDKIKAETSLLQRFWKQILFGVIALLIFLNLGSCDGLDKWNKFKEWEKQSKQAVIWGHKQDSLAIKSKLESDSIASLNKKLEETLSKSKSNADLLRHKNDSLSKLVFHGGPHGTIVTNLPDTCNKVVELAIGLKLEVDTLKGIVHTDSIIHNNDIARINKLDFSYHTEKSRGDSLSRIIVSMPQPEGPCTLLGFIPCTTRKQTFVLGAVLGIVGVAEGHNIISIVKKL